MKKYNPDIETDYLSKVYQVSRFTDTINKSVEKLRAFKKKYPFQAIAFTGTSGAALAYPLSYKLKIPLICVRKDADNHYGRRTEGWMGKGKYIIVDDFIDSGNTIDNIIRAISLRNNLATPVGILLYTQTSSMKFYGSIPVLKLK